MTVKNDDANDDTEDHSNNEREDFDGVTQEPGEGGKVAPGVDLGKHLRDTISSLGLLDGIANKMAEFGKRVVPESQKIIPPDLNKLSRLNEPMKLVHIPVDDSKWRTARAVEATADAAKLTASFTNALLIAMEQSVSLNEQTRQENAAMAKFTRRMSIASLVISIGSVGAAVAALFVAIFRTA